MSYVRPDLSHPYAQRFIDFFRACIGDNVEKTKHILFCIGRKGSTESPRSMAI